MIVSYSDIQGHWAKDCIHQLVIHNLAHGYLDGRFAPDKSLTRAEFAAFIYSAFSTADRVRESVDFKDLSNSHWAFDAIQFAYQAGFLSGYPGQYFKPDVAMPRVQVITALVSGFGHDNGNIVDEILAQYFDDAAEIPAYGARAIATAIQQRLIVNYPHLRQFRPNADITRGELAAILCRAFKFYVVPHEFIVGPTAEFPHPDALMLLRPKFKAIGDSLEDVSPNLFVEGLARLDINGRSGFMDEQGQMVLPFDLIVLGNQTFSENRLPVLINSQHGYIDKTGEVVIAPQFERAESFANGLAIVATEPDERSAYRYGVINHSGEFVFQPQYERITPFNDGLAIARDFNGISHGIKHNGEVVFTIEDIWCRDGFTEGHAIITKDRKYGLLDQTGQLVLPPKYNRLGGISEGRTRAKLNPTDQGYLCLDLAGNPITPTRFKSLSPFLGGFARATTLDDEKGYLDREGNFSTEFEWIGPFSDGLATAYTSTHQGYINVERQWVIPPTFADTRQSPYTNGRSHDSHFYYFHTFSEGRAAVGQNGKFGFIDKTGTMVIPAQFDWVEPFSEGLAAVHRDGEDFYIDLTGQTVFKSHFPGSQHYRHKIVSFRHGYALFQTEGRFGLIDKTGKVVIPAQFDHLQFIESQAGNYRWIRVNLNSKYPKWDAPLRPKHRPYRQDHNWGLIRLPKNNWH